MGYVQLAVRRPLARKLLWLIAPPLVLILVSVQFFSYAALKRRILEDLDQRLSLMSAQYALVISNLFRQYSNDVKTLSEAPLIADYYKNSEYQLREEAEAYRRELGQYFLKFQKRGKIYARIRYLDAEGREVCSTDGLGGKSAKSAPPEPFFALLKSRPHEIYRSKLEPGLSGEKDRIIRCAKAVLSPLGEFKGVLVLDADVGAIERLLGGIRIGQSGGAYLVDPKNGLVVSRPGLAGMSLGVRRPIPGTAWEIVLAADGEEFLEPLKRVERQSALVGLAGVLLLLFVIFAGMRAGMAPLGELLEAIRKISRGELDQAIAVKGEDEIAEVSRAFNQMAESLRLNEKGLQDKIEQLLALHTLSDAIISRMDREQILMTCLQAALRGLRFDRGTLYWIDRERQELVGSCAYGIERLDNEAMRKRRIPLSGNDVLAHVVRGNAPIYVGDPSRDPRCNPVYVEESKTRAFCAVPIRGKQSILGVIAADNYYTERAILPEDIRSLSLFANSAGVALENMSLLNKISRDEVRRRMILDNAVEAILGLDASFRIMTWNRGAQNLFGHAPSEALGKSVALLFGDGALGGMIKHVLARGSARNYEIEGVTKTGGKLQLNLTLAGAETEASKNKEWAMVIRDMTEQKKLQTQLVQAEKLSAIGQLISGIAHEISNPLAAVVGYAQMCLQDKPPARIQEDLRLIEENTERCKKIIDNLLLFVRQGPPARAPVSVSDAVLSVRRLMAYELQKRDSIRVIQDLDQRGRPVLGDMQQLEQVFINIFKNACDALHGMAGEKRIEVKSRQDGGLLRLEISDNGPGMSADVIQKIFDPFFTTKPAGQGTGLGLAVTRQIVAEHGGVVSCKSQPGRGTTFVIELPTTSADARAGALPEPCFEPCPHKRILVVDDERDMARLIGKLMRQDDDTAELAFSGLKALRLLSHRHYDLIITDMALGRLHGDRILEYWKKNLRGRGTKALAITGDVLNSAVMELLKRHKVPYVTKPFDLNALRQKARQLLSPALSVPAHS